MLDNKGGIALSKPIYLDYNATTPIAAEALAGMLPWLSEHFGNPSSSHYYGIKAREAVEEARVKVASLLCCEPGEIVFTSGGSESNNYAIKGIAWSQKSRGNHIITSAVEHPAVLRVCDFLKTSGFDVTVLPVDEYGLVHVEDVEAAITQRTILITIMHANNEVGTIEPVSEIARIARANNMVMHTDAAQSTGKIPVSVRESGVDLLSIAGHKLYAPKGIGALYIRKGLKLETLIHGAGHEAGRRAGTENVPYIVGLGRACEVAERDIEKNGRHMQNMRDRLHKAIMNSVPNVKLNGHPESRLPNTLSLGFRGIDAHRLVEEIKDLLAVSPGAACHSGATEISSVLRAMNVPPEWAMGTVRFSTGRETKEGDVDRAAQIISDKVAELRRI